MSPLPALFYRADDGLTVTGAVNSSGGFTSLQGVGGFSPGWTHVVSVGGGRVLFYRAGDGVAATGVVDSSGGFANLQTVGGFSPGWTHIVPAGGGRMLFYRAGDGVAVTGVVNSSGGFANLQTVGGLSPGWTHIVPAGDGGMLFYRAGDGVAATGVVNSSGGFTSLQGVGGFTPGWTHIAPTSDGRMLFYRAGDGLAVTGFVNDSGGFVSLQGVGGFLPGWTQIVPVGGGRLLFYRAGDGLAVTGVVDVTGGGGFVNLQGVGGFTPGWTHIAGPFTGQVNPGFDFTRPDVVTNLLSVPWGLAFLPDGSALVSERNTARVLQLRPGSNPQPVATVPGVVALGEGGLLGLAVSPTYATDQWVYAFFTATSDNRIVRFRLNAPATVQVVLSGLAKAGSHNGGRIAFGPDGMLYAGTGDAGLPDSSQSLTSENGKILRMRPDGSVPQDNPFPGSRIYSLGHRNVQGLAWDSQGQLWATEFGQSTWDEVNLIVSGGNYGWPVVEGAANNPNYRNPMVQWRPDEASPSGAAIVGGNLFVAALYGQRLWQVALLPNGSVDTPTARLTHAFGRLRTVALGPDGWLWVTTSNRDGRGSFPFDFVVRFPPTTLALVTVPNVTGLSCATAIATVNSAGFVASCPGGTVTAQSPAAGTKAAYGSTIALTVGTTVPNVIGLSCTTAIATANAAGFVATCPGGTVTAQSPAAGTTAAYGSTITLTVGTTVPDVLALTQSVAESRITAAGLTTTVSFQNTCVDTGTVQGQDAAGGTQVALGSTVSISVSTCTGGGKDK